MAQVTTAATPSMTIEEAKKLQSWLEDHEITFEKDKEIKNTLIANHKSLLKEHRIFLLLKNKKGGRAFTIGQLNFIRRTNPIIYYDKQTDYLFILIDLKIEEVFA